MTRSKTLGNLIALSIALAVSLLAGEAMLRAVVELPLQRPLPEVRYDDHPVRRFTLRPAQTGYSYGAPASVDGRGFRANGTGRDGGADGTPTIFALGDSFTFGMGVRDEQTWPARLEALLKGRRESVRVINGGTISYGVFQEMDLLRTSGLATHPRVIVHALYWNDFMNPEPPPLAAPSVVTPGGYLSWDQLDAERGWLPSTASWAISHSALLFSLRQAGLRVVSTGGGATGGYGQAYETFLERGLTDDEWTPIERFYTEMQALARTHDFEILAVILPVNDIVMGSQASSHPYPVAARARLEALGIPYVDAFSLWEHAKYGGRHFLPQGHDAHLNATGYDILAQALQERVLGLGVLGRDGDLTSAGTK